MYDRSLRNAGDLVCGANKQDTHMVGLDIRRDLGTVDFVDAAKTVDGGLCPCCGKTGLNVSRGVEVGNIFQLGDKYTRTMQMTYLDENGKTQYPVMGCYGIGVGRLAACICEAHHDDRGPIWPLAVAPWQVHLCAVRADDENVRKKADALYADLQAAGIEVIYDDRLVSAGVMFADADLLGIPYRIIVSPRNLKENCCEIISRDKVLQIKVAPEECLSVIGKIFAEA
jgi:prolyl-tRNA synthetase